MPQALNVRSAPSSDAEIVNYLRTGNRVEVLVAQPGWAFVSSKTRSGGVIKGWVSTRFLDPEAVEVSVIAGDKVAAEEAPLVTDEEAPLAMAEDAPLATVEEAPLATVEEVPLATVEEAPLLPVDPSEQLLPATLEAANN